MPRSDIHKDGVKTRFKPQGDIPLGGELAKRPLTVKVVVEVDTAIRALPEQSAWLRRVITSSARSELMGEPSTTPQVVAPASPPVPPVDTATRAELLEVVNHALTTKTQSSMRSALNRLKTYLENQK